MEKKLEFSAAVPFLMAFSAIKKFHTMAIGELFVGLCIFVPIQTKTAGFRGAL